MLSRRLDGYGVGVADYDRDGWLDMVVGYETYYALIRNVQGACSDAHWLSVRLQGRGAVNRDAVGARVDLTRSDGMVMRRDVVLGSGLGASHDLALHFGLEAHTVERVEITWPDGLPQTLVGVDSDQELRVVYPESP